MKYSGLTSFAKLIKLADKQQIIKDVNEKKEETMKEMCRWEWKKDTYAFDSVYGSYELRSKFPDNLEKKFDCVSIKQTKESNNRRTSLGIYKW